MTILQERAVIAVLHVGSWGSKAVDQKVTEDVSERHSADQRDAGKYTKQLVATRFLKPIREVASAATRTHKVLTLPWEDNGSRILACTGHKDYTDTMRNFRVKHDNVVNAVCTLDAYEEWIDEAKVRLGTMYNADDYASLAEVKRRFYLDVEIKGVPSAKDFRAEMSDASVKAITKDIERRAEERLNQAMNEVFNRVLKVTGHMVDRLKNYQPATGRQKGELGVNFKDSTITNIKELADILPSLNLTDDPRLVNLQQQLLSDLVAHSPEILKSDPKLRNEVARKAEKIHSKVKSYLA